MHHVARRALVRSLQQETTATAAISKSSTSALFTRRFITHSSALFAPRHSPRDDAPFASPRTPRTGRRATAAANATSQQTPRSNNIKSTEAPIQSSTSTPTGDWKAAVAAFEQFQHAPEPAEVLDLVTLCVTHDRHREAQDVVRRAQKLGVDVPVRAHALVCAAIAKKGDVDRAFALLDALAQTHRESFSVAVYEPLLSVLKAQSDWRATHRTIQHMHTHKLSPPLRAYRVLMLTAAKARQRDTLVKTIAFVQTQFPDANRDVATLTATCQALVSIGDNARVLALYGTLDTAWLAAHGNTLLFNNVLLAAVKHDSVLDRALSILDAMQRSEHGQPDDFTYATCMLELEKRSDWDGVLTLYNAMQDRDVQQQQASSRTNAKSVVNALTCAAVVRALHSAPGATPRSIKRDLHVVLKPLAAIDVSTLGHASSLIDTLDEFQLYTAARQVFARLVRERVLVTDAWLRHDGFEIDLHTFSRGVAKCAVVYAFEQLKTRHERQFRATVSETAPQSDLRIIVGVGKHSKQYLAPTIRDAVTRMFAQSFRPPLWPANHPTNPGVLVVRAKTLRNWVRRDGVVRYF